MKVFLAWATNFVRPQTRTSLGDGRRSKGKAYGLAGILAHYPVVGAGCRHTAGDRTSGGVLDHLLSLALEISRRGSVCSAHRAASDCAGFYVLVALGPHSPLGRGWEALTGHTLAFTFEGLVIGSILYSFPFAVQPFAASFAAVDSRLVAASQTLGASRLRTFFRVILPLSVSGVVTGVALSFAHTMGEFGVVLMVGGNIPGVTRTVSIDIYDKVQAVNYSGANATALVLLAISFVTLAVVYGLNRRVWMWK